MLNRKAGGRCWSAPRECDWCQSLRAQDISHNLDISLLPLLCVCNTVLVTSQQMLTWFPFSSTESVQSQWTNRLIWKPQSNFNAFKVFKLVSAGDFSLRPLRAENRPFNIFFKSVLLFVLVLLCTDTSSIDFDNRTAKKNSAQVVRNTSLTPFLLNSHLLYCKRTPRQCIQHKTKISKLCTVWMDINFKVKRKSQNRYRHWEWLHLWVETCSWWIPSKEEQIVPSCWCSTCPSAAGTVSPVPWSRSFQGIKQARLVLQMAREAEPHKSHQLVLTSRSQSRYQFFKLVFSASEKQTTGFDLGTHTIRSWKAYPGVYICLLEMCVTLALNWEHQQLKLTLTERFLDAFQHKVLFHFSTSSQPVEQPTEGFKDFAVTLCITD